MEENFIGSQSPQRTVVLEKKKKKKKKRPEEKKQMHIQEDIIDLRLDSSGSGYGPMAGSCRHGNEPSDSINGGTILY
jgi:hypothetical protein